MSSEQGDPPSADAPDDCTDPSVVSVQDGAGVEIAPVPALPPFFDSLLSQVDPGYYHGRIGQFNAVMNALADTADALGSLAGLSDIDAQTKADVAQWLSDFEAKKDQFRAAAQQVNAAIQAAGAISPALPAAAVPMGLSGMPVMVASVATASALVRLGREYLQRAQELAARYLETPDLPNEQFLRAAQLQDRIAGDARSCGGALSQLSPMALWGGLGLAALAAYRIWKWLR
jgi:hypothetical protein